MNKELTLQEHLENAINDLRKKLDRVENKKSSLSREKLCYAIKELDDLDVKLRKIILF